MPAAAPRAAAARDCAAVAALEQWPLFASPVAHLVHAGRQQLDDCELPPASLQLLPRAPVVKGALDLHMLAPVAPCRIQVRHAACQQQEAAYAVGVALLPAMPLLRAWRAV